MTVSCWGQVERQLVYIQVRIFGKKEDQNQKGHGLFLSGGVFGKHSTLLYLPNTTYNTKRHISSPVISTTHASAKIWLCFTKK